MNWKLIGGLSFPGLLLEIASYSDKLGGADVWAWLAYGMFCAVLIARLVPDQQFSHAFVTGLVVGGLVRTAVVLWMPSTYPSSPAVIALTSARMFAPFAAVGGGLALMLLTWLAAILVGNRR